MDINNLSETKLTLNKLIEEFGRIDLVIVSAGIGDINNELDFDKELNTITTNIISWTHLVDLLYISFENQGYGHLVLITSIGGLRGECAAPAYSASKAYQINYTEALSKKAYKSNANIHITDIRPGLVNTAMAKGEGLFWVMPAQKVACQIKSAIEKKKHIAIITKRWKILAFIQKHLPWFIYKRM